MSTEKPKPPKNREICSCGVNMDDHPNHNHNIEAICGVVIIVLWMVISFYIGLYK